MRRMRKDRFALGSFADVPDVWRYALLRQLAEPACQQTCARQRASGHRFRAAGRALAILLFRRRVLRILGVKRRRIGPIGYRSL